MIRTRVLWCAVLIGCGGGGSGGGGGDDDGGGNPLPLPSPSCEAANAGSATVAAPVLAYTLKDRYQEAWLGSASVVDLDGDGTPEIIVPRDDLLEVWHAGPGAGGTLVWSKQMPGRIWASPVVAEIVKNDKHAKQVAVASRGEVHLLDATGKEMSGFPFTWQDELRGLAAGDIDGDGNLELVAVTTSPASDSYPRDSVVAIYNDGSTVHGFPPNTSGSSGCTATTCYITGGYDQNIALGDVDGDHQVDVFVSQDNAYMSLHSGTGGAFDAAAIYKKHVKFAGIRWMVDYALAQGGVGGADADLQAHFTNTGPSIADLDGDGTAELIALGSIQNVAQDQREQGVGLFVSHHDGTRPAAWVTPPRFPDYLGGLWDSETSDNVVGITNQVAVAELDPAHAGLEVVFAGFDGAIHAVDAQAQTLWTRKYTSDAETWTSGVVVADLSGDGVPEIVFTTYGPRGGDLIILDAAGNEQQRVALGGRGAMPAPTIADVDGDGDLDIVVSLKDAVDKQKSVVVYEVPGSASNCVLWPTARGNDRRDGYLPPK